MSQRCSDIESGLPTHSGQKGIRLLDLYDTLDDFWEQWLDVDAVGHLGIVLYGCWIGVD